MNVFSTAYPFPIVLASTSSFRKHQFMTLGYPFICDSPQVNEEDLKKMYNSLPITSLALKLAEAKAESLKQKYSHYVLIGADQICHYQNITFSKPLTFDKAFEQLNVLQGKEHTLTTAVSVCYKNTVLTHVDQTHLRMRNLSEQDIHDYLQMDKPFFSAGSYMFEKNGQKLFTSVLTQDPSSIIGLPLMAYKHFCFS